MDTEIRHLLPWYVNGTLIGAERDRVEAALRSDADAASFLAWEQATQNAVKNDPLFDVADDRGLARTMQRIRAAASTKAASASGSAGSSWLARLAQGLRWSPALAVACGVVAVQFAVITQMWSTRGEENDYSSSRSVIARPSAKEAFIRVVFKPETTEVDLRAVLRGVQADIVSGPSQLGDYYVLVAKNIAPEALALLQGNDHVDAAESVDALPARQ